MLALTGYISVRLAKRRLNRVFQLLRDDALGDQQLRQGIIINVGERAYDQVFSSKTNLHGSSSSRFNRT
jgi:hypothetical protein